MPLIINAITVAPRPGHNFDCYLYGCPPPPLPQTAAAAAESLAFLGFFKKRARSEEAALDGGAAPAYDIDEGGGAAAAFPDPAAAPDEEPILSPPRPQSPPHVPPFNAENAMDNDGGGDNPLLLGGAFDFGGILRSLSQILTGLPTLDAQAVVTSLDEQTEKKRQLAENICEERELARIKGRDIAELAEKNGLVLRDCATKLVCVPCENFGNNQLVQTGVFDAWVALWTFMPEDVAISQLRNMGMRRSSTSMARLSPRRMELSKRPWTSASQMAGTFRKFRVKDSAAPSTSPARS